jgi:hypothetical protein
MRNSLRVRGLRQPPDPITCEASAVGCYVVDLAVDCIAPDMP